MLQRIGKSCAVKTNVTKRLTEAEDSSFSVGKSMRRDIGDLCCFESDKDIKSQSAHTEHSAMRLGYGCHSAGAL